jgi:Uri superfamily endonuclease
MGLLGVGTFIYGAILQISDSLPFESGIFYSIIRQLPVYDDIFHEAEQRKRRASEVGMKNTSHSTFFKGRRTRIALLGDCACGGAYVLRIVVQRNLRVRFGRFMGGRQIAVESGTYVYVGSAMGTWKKLGQRLARHASRSGSTKAQEIREDIVDAFGVGVLPKGEKRLRWHVDFLLDRHVVTVTHVLAICSEDRLEGVIADGLLNDDATQVLAPGLGASDAPGKTHLLRVPDEIAWWHAFVSSIR